MINFTNRKYTAKVGQDNVNIGVVTIFRLANISLLQVYVNFSASLHFCVGHIFSKIFKPKKRSDLLGEINSDIKIMCSNKQNVTLKQKIMVQDNKKMWF